MRRAIIVLAMLGASMTSALAQISVGFGVTLPGVSIGINLPMYPDLVRVPGYPVYYAPQVDSNFFFYDGVYWVYQNDNWYTSSWYNGPWSLVDPDIVPVYILRVPVRYYRVPPVYFRSWRMDAPPRWGDHWGRDWDHRRHGWDRWDRRSAPAPAPLPVYQRRYSGDRYPHATQQPSLHGEHYRYRPRDPVVRQQHRDQEVRRAPAPSQHVPQGDASSPPSQEARQPGQPGRGRDRDKGEERGRDRGGPDRGEDRGGKDRNR